nr:uncharacterized protein LOC127311644 [Lolium perenne]
MNNTDSVSKGFISIWLLDAPSTGVMGQEGAWSTAHSHGGLRAVECARVEELWGSAALGQCCEGDGSARVGLLSLNSSDPPSSGDEERSLLLSEKLFVLSRNGCQ